MCIRRREAEGKPLRLICLPAQLDYFLGDCPAGSWAPSSVQECLPLPARQLAHRPRRCRKWDGDPSGPGL